ncbi:hypothetical protein C8R43DRAFT_1049005 [Mycena crocata]|nr:hypothetical protein C8R43DRAFT_1049005 [Mycena crocata]
MHFTPAILSLIALAVCSVQGAPSLAGSSTSLTKRWCGFQASCPCQADPKIGCELTFDECAQVWFWPPVCQKCGTCPEICVDSFCLGESDA